MPKVTVLMAVYNGERYLHEAIQSILVQTFQDFEFLIINDGSTDRTREVILSYDDPRIRLVDNAHNLGLTRSLNRGLELSRGQLVARQDADDVSEPERLSKQIAFLESHPDVVLLGSWYTKIDAEGAPIGNRRLPCDCLHIRWHLLFHCPFVHSSVMLPKAVVLERIGFYNEAFAYAQDYDLWRRIARRFPVANLGECLVRYRISPSSMTATFVEKLEEGPQISIANIDDLLGADGTKMVINAGQLSIMTSLLWGSQVNLSQQEVNWATAAILRLHVAFCRSYGVDRRSCRMHRAAVCSDMSWRLTRMADLDVDQDNYATARRLLVKAVRLHWPILFAKRQMRLCFKLLVGPRLTRVIMRLMQKAIH
jgi:hypothetical protein